MAEGIGSWDSGSLMGMNKFAVMLRH
jgi:tetratricopeptide (TPR) repeat protein